MIIDIKKLNATKSYYGEMEFTYEAPQELVNIPFTEFDGPVLVKFEYDLYEDNALEIRGTLSYKLKGQCSRCLKDAKATVEGELTALFEPKSDAEDYSYFGSIVDITNAVNDAIVFSMPFSLSCGNDCEEIRYSSESN